MLLPSLAVWLLFAACEEALRGNDKVHQPCICPAGLSLASGHVWGCLDPEKQLDKLAWFGRGGLCNCAALHSKAGERPGSMSPHLLAWFLCQRLYLQFCAAKRGNLSTHNVLCWQITRSLHSVQSVLQTLRGSACNFTSCTSFLQPVNSCKADMVWVLVSKGIIILTAQMHVYRLEGVQSCMCTDLHAMQPCKGLSA